MGQGILNAIRSAPPQDAANVASHPSRYRAEGQTPALSIHIQNMEQIKLAYGAGAAQAASDHVRSIIKFELRDGDHAGSAEYVLRRLSEHPVTYDGQRFHLTVSLAPTSDAGGCAIQASTVHGNPAFPDDAWCRCYRADMALAVNLFAAMADDRLVFAWQPVRHADDPSQILYHECLLRIVNGNAVAADDALQPVGEMVEALERLGLVRALDRHVMGLAIAELRIDASRKLGVNISALSLVRDHWWDDAFASLEQAPLFARGLFIEITETAPIPSVADAADLIARLRRFGCKIALDDFGTGHTAMRSILTLSPDVVKIDKFFVHHAKASPAGRRTLAHLIGLAESLGAIVIVEGIESAADQKLAREAGARWQQGYHLGRPSMSRPWRLKGSALPASGAFACNEGATEGVASKVYGAALPDAAGAGIFPRLASGNGSNGYHLYPAGETRRAAWCGTATGEVR